LTIGSLRDVGSAAWKAASVELGNESPELIVRNNDAVGSTRPLFEVETPRIHLKGGSVDELSQAHERSADVTRDAFRPRSWNS